MRTARFVVLAVAGSVPWTAACEGPGGESHATLNLPDAGDASRGTGGLDASTDARPDASTDASPDATSDAPEAFATFTPTLASLRFAAWSPDGPSSVDFCIRKHGSGAYGKPLIGTSGCDAGGGLCFPQVSAYLSVDPGQYDVRLVGAASGADCSDAGLLDLTDAGALAAGAAATVALIGEPGNWGVPLRLASFSDETAAAPAFGSMAAIRVVNADPGPPSFGFSVGLTVKPIAYLGGNIAFGTGSEGTDPRFDSNGYLWFSIPIGGSVPLNIPFFASPVAIPVSAGSVVTAVVLGVPGGVASATGACPEQCPPMAPSCIQASCRAALLLGCFNNAGVLGAFSPCPILTVSTCGDNVVDPFEQCDVGMLNGTMYEGAPNMVYCTTGCQDSYNALTPR